MGPTASLLLKEYSFKGALKQNAVLYFVIQCSLLHFYEEI